jgi:hypothetical protein
MLQDAAAGSLTAQLLDPGLEWTMYSTGKFVGDQPDTNQTLAQWIAKRRSLQSEDMSYSWLRNKRHPAALTLYSARQRQCHCTQP